MRFINKLSFRLSAPVFVVTFLLWAVLYLFVAQTIGVFTHDRANDDLKSISHEALDICNTAFEALIDTGRFNDPREVRVVKALTMGNLEEFLAEFKLHGLVLEGAEPHQHLAMHTLEINGEAPGAVNNAVLDSLYRVELNGKRFFAYSFDFQPWDWHIVILREKTVYESLATQVRNLHRTIGGLLLVMAFGLVLVENRMLSRPVNTIVGQLRRGETPVYEGIEELAFLSNSIADMMQTLADREARLRESEIRYRTIFETTGTAIAIVEEDTTISLVNHEFLEYSGFTREEVERKKSWTVIVAEEDLERLTRIYQLRQIDPAEAPRQFEFTMIDKRGRSKSMLLTADVIPETTQSIFSLIDITDRKKEELQRRLELEAQAAEELRGKNAELGREIESRKRIEHSLRASEERFRAVFETAEDSIIIKDSELRYTHINPAGLRLLDMHKSQVVGRDDEALSLDGFFGPHGKSMEKRVLAGQSVESEHTVLWKGWPVCLNVSRFPLTDFSGNIFGICAIARDVSDRKEATRPDGDDPVQDYPSKAMQETFERLNKAAELDVTVLLLGETGAGKDYLARYLHDRSPRSGGPFFAVNCAALNPGLIESELFGHQKGAFTGAQARKRGLLELAEGGTLLLNEIGEMPVSAQAKLLTFLDTGSFTRIGGERNVSPDSRIIAATNRNLHKAIEQGTFREDLYYRLSVVTITVPPLRERSEDLPALVNDLLHPLCRKMGLSKPPVIDIKAMESMMNYRWPGNVRELRNVLERALMRSDRANIIAQDLEIRRDSSVLGGASAGDVVQDLVYYDKTLPEIVNETKRRAITEALRRCGGSIKEACVMLGVTYESLRYQIKSLHIEK